MTIAELYRYLEDNGIYPSYIRTEYDDINEVEHTVVSIDWGDWKHEHLRCKYLMLDAGYGCDGTVTTNEDGSDCYSADHYYYKLEVA